MKTTGHSNTLLRTGPVLVAVYILAQASAAAMESVSTRRNPLPDRGFLELSVPREWKDELHQPPDKLSPTIVFRSSRPLQLMMLITPIRGVNTEPHY